MKLMDRIAVVTGAGSGIGRATASMFAREGARVAVVDLEEATAKATVEEIERAGGHALAIRADVSKAADNEAVVGQTIARWGRLDIFFANAGVPQFPTPIEDVEESTFDRIMSVNVKGVFLGAKCALRVMKRQKSGVFLVTASTSAIRPRPGVQSYSASKGAVVTLVKSLALESAPLRRARRRHRPGGDGDADAGDVHGQDGGRRGRDDAVPRHRAARAPEHARRSRQDRGLPRLRRCRHDHRDLYRGRRRPLHLTGTRA